MPSNATFLVNATSPNPRADKAFQVATNPQATNVTPESAKLLITAFGLRSLRTVAFRENVGEPLSTGVERDYLVPDPATINTGQLDTVVGGSFKYAPCGFALSDSAEDMARMVTLDAALLSIRQSKNIVTTAIQGRDGTVKEFTSLGDYLINVKGVMVGRNSDDYPAGKVKALLEVLKRNTDIVIDSSYLKDFYGITTVVVSDWSMPQKEGMQNVQMFDINLMSDKPVELRTASNAGD